VEVLVSGVNLFYTDNGKTNAPVLIFIHGFPFDHTMWQEQVRLTEPSFRVITYDHRGHGKSGVGSGQYIFETFVDDLLGLMDALMIPKAILCGLSMGGYVALRTAEKAPGRVSGLVLCDTRSEADTNEGKLKRAAAVRTVEEKGVSVFAEGFLKAIFAPSSFTDKPEVVDQIRRIMDGNSALGICGTLIALATRTDTTAYLPQIKVPTLILVGESDAVTPPSAAQAMHDHIAGSRISMLAKAGHMSNLDNSADFNRHLQDFLKIVL
jgi:3-oxoadipate enol-lactonase